MANEYSVEIHQYLNEKIEIAEKALKECAEGNPYLKGLIDELLWIRRYLSDNIDLKDFTYY
jgi:hypothetical protein